MASEVGAAWDRLFVFFGILCYILAWSTRFLDVFRIIAIVCTGIAFACVVVVLHKNISFVMMKRLMKEPNVIIIIVLTYVNWAIEIGQPHNSLSPIFGFIFANCKWVCIDGRCDVEKSIFNDWSWILYLLS